MIASIRGIVNFIGKDHVVLVVGGIGLRVFVPRPVLESISAVGRSLNLHTHLVVKETELSLYGFESEEDLMLFEVLLDVNGVGPKVGLAILSTMSPEVLKGAIAREEPAVLQRVPGIGKKTSERIMFHLRDKLDLTADMGARPFVTDLDGEVIDVLTSLGFSIVESQTALQHIPRDVTDLNARVQLALQQLDQA
ncbi:MAG TPA: Holliday junction branch migration protein RuvA [Patescibacteria group bacterium]|jgi:Holliday junction DNA helicase RuvA|nr:Holliday junction branch migration protein RuvA [Patescibacteria group bacterium]